MHWPLASRIIGFVLRMVWPAFCQVLAGVRVFGTYIKTMPPTSGAPLLSINCCLPFGTRLAVTENP